MGGGSDDESHSYDDASHEQNSGVLDGRRVLTLAAAIVISMLGEEE
jgi:hypothetical protein